MHTGTTFPCFCLSSTMVSLIHGTTLLWVAAFLVLKSLYYWWLCLFTLYWNLANLSFVTSNGQNQEYVLKSKKKKKKKKYCKLKSVFWKSGYLRHLIISSLVDSNPPDKYSYEINHSFSNSLTAHFQIMSCCFFFALKGLYSW